jgi:glycosyltransferase involved in cell wall biosynthesis
MDRTGAPSQLVTLLPGLGERLSARTTLLHGSDGPLVEAASAHVDRVRREPAILRALGRAARRAPSRVGRPLERVRAAALRTWIGPLDVVYVNSLISARLARAFGGHPLVVHVHEMGSLADQLADSLGGDAQELLRAAARVLVPSEPARRWVLSCGVPAERVVVLPGAVPAAAFEPPDAPLVDELQAHLSVDDRTRVVTSVGWVGPLKGSDRFLEVAEHVRSQMEEPVRFLWIGAGSSTGEERRFRSEIGARGLEGVVTTAAALDDLRPALALSDVTLVTSREETLSLVALESAAQGTPVVAFPGAGGPDELAREGIVTTPQGGGPGVAAAVTELLRAAPRREAAGRLARDRVLELHHADRARAVLADVLERVAGGVSTAPGRAG